ncbi:MAG: 16S rRNA (cytidine(1402)-2'-O)-methyltransferase [Ureaplasma sp.]|nr:16S rRNA (cytidine(1402)-2'-O)-methyltransferase [Ureaplasma sp.]
MKTFNSQYKINVLATPIGNINEVTPRFINTINESDVILCEDTRITKKLLNLLEIKKQFKLIKFELHNENEIIDDVIKMIKNNQIISLVSDAGYPTISDPGYKLINECINNEIAINVINGPSSVMHALVGSGLISQDFFFLGFIGKTKNERKKKLIKYANFETTFIIFESPHRLKDCLLDLREILNPKSKICIARELTKLHEEFIYSTIEEINEMIIDPKGEYVIVVKNILNTNNNLNIEKEIIKLKKLNYKTKDISRIISQEFNIDQHEVYSHVIEINNRSK